jgi:hypothetical protein
MLQKNPFPMIHSSEIVIQILKFLLEIKILENPHKIYYQYKARY